MARLWASGFELNTLTNGVEITDKSGTPPTIVTTTVRSGTYALQVNPAGATTFIRYQFAASNQSAAYFFRCYVNFSSFPGSSSAYFFAILDATDTAKISIRVNASGNLLLFNEQAGTQIGSNSSALSTGTWYRIELKVDTTTLSSTACDARLNGVSFASGTANLSTGIAIIYMGWNSAVQSVNYFMDDVAINDATGGSQNSWPGDGALNYLFPNAAGDNNAFTVQIGGTIGSANNYTRVNEIPPDDATSYNGDTVSGDIDDFNITNTPSTIAASDTITVVAVGVRYRAVVAAGESPFVARCKKTSGGTVSESSVITPNSTSWTTNANAAPSNYPLVLYNDPDSNPWTKATLDSAQIGYRITSTGTNATDITTIWMVVESFTSGFTFQQLTPSGQEMPKEHFEKTEVVSY